MVHTLDTPGGRPVKPEKVLGAQLEMLLEKGAWKVNRVVVADARTSCCPEEPGAVRRSGPGTHSSVPARRALPLVAEAVLDGRVGREQAAALTALVGPIGSEDLLDAEAGLIAVVSGRTTGFVKDWVRELIATHCLALKPPPASRRARY